MSFWSLISVISIGLLCCAVVAFASPPVERRDLLLSARLEATHSAIVKRFLPNNEQEDPVDTENTSTPVNHHTGDEVMVASASSYDSGASTGWNLTVPVSGDSRSSGIGSDATSKPIPETRKPPKVLNQMFTRNETGEYSFE